MTLSHCWGSQSSHTLTTTKDTIEDRIRSIEFDAGSKTFVQAAEVTRTLGIQYLWIDSLCIIQDSEEDWSRESQKMGDIYHNATVTLSADAAQNASQGLFPDSRERSLLHNVFKLSYPAPNEATSSIRIRSLDGDPSSLKKLSHSSTPSGSSKLSTRGWVIQESTLSPRMLYFSKKEMYWICSTLSRCECKIRPGQAPSGLFRKPLGALQSLRTESDAQFLRDLYMEWPLLVMDFTCRDLTRKSDRLPALSGLADWMQRQTNDLYLCGLWAGNLLFELLWYVEASTQETHCRLVEPYAPSWSWASITGPITYYRPYVTQFGQRYPGYQDYEVDVRVSKAHTDRDETPVKILDLAVHPFGLNKYGPGQAFIKLSGHVLPVKYDRSRESWESPIITLAYFDPKWLEFKYDIYSEIPDILAAASGEGTFVLFFTGIVMPPGGAYAVGSQVICLLLQRVEGPVPVFKRRGVVTKAGDDETWKSSVPRSTIILA